MEKLKQIIKANSQDNFVFFGKLIIIAVYFSLTITGLGYTDLPLIEVFENNMNPIVPFAIWQISFLTFSILAFLNRRPKLFLFLNGVLIILALLMNELCYSNNLFFAACMLITFSISNASFNFVPVQLSIVYFGAFIDKFLFEQWRNGDFMTAYFPDNPILMRLSIFMDYDLLIMVMTWSTLIIEFALFILILIPKTRDFCMILGLFFHFSTIILMSSFFGIFIILILISYFAMVRTTIDFQEELKISKLRAYINELLLCRKCKDKIWYRFHLNDKTHDNYKALILSFLLNPFTVILLTLFFTTTFINVKKIVLFVLIAIVFIFAFGNKFKFPRKKTL